MFGLSFRKRAEPSKGAQQIAALQAHFFPRISIQEHAYAKAKIARERQKFMLLVFPDGTRVPVYSGEYSWDDLRAAEGYGVTIEGYDCFGWPKGHPESPVNIATHS